MLKPSDPSIQKSKVVEHGVDRFVWSMPEVLDLFDDYEPLIERDSYERVKVAFACAALAREDAESSFGGGLSAKQVAAVASLPELDAFNCTQQLLNKRLISFEARPEKGLAGVEVKIVGFLGEPRYQMREKTAERILKELAES